MARWRLKNKHYLAVPGTEYEYKETARETGRQQRVVMPVPLFLDPEDKGDMNYPQDGMIIVADSHSAAFPRDIIFVGEPTPDMEPLDDEAQKITDSLQGRWADAGAPYANFDTFGEKLLRDFNVSIAEAMARPANASPAPGTGPNQRDFDALMSQVAALADQNAKLSEQLASLVPAPSAEHSARRVPNA